MCASNEAAAQHQAHRCHGSGSDLRKLRRQAGSVRALLLPLRHAGFASKAGSNRFGLSDLWGKRWRRIRILPELRFARRAAYGKRLGLPGLRRNAGGQRELLPDVRTSENLNINAEAAAVRLQL